MADLSFDEAFNNFVEKRIHEVLTNKTESKLKELLESLESELLSLLSSESDRDKLKEIFFKILSEQNQICYELGLADSRSFSLKFSK
jgi:succinate dehydrogenase flavin-adding protein (antitoxin of CptAB toxin-antitoxin module)